jgi:hypothetical protein
MTALSLILILIPKESCSKFHFYWHGRRSFSIFVIGADVVFYRLWQFDFHWRQKIGTYSNYLLVQEANNVPPLLSIPLNWAVLNRAIF